MTASDGKIPGSCRLIRTAENIVAGDDPGHIFLTHATERRQSSGGILPHQLHNQPGGRHAHFFRRLRYRQPGKPIGTGKDDLIPAVLFFQIPFQSGAGGIIILQRSGDPGIRHPVVGRGQDHAQIGLSVGIRITVRRHLHPGGFRPVDGIEQGIDLVPVPLQRGFQVADLQFSGSVLREQDRLLQRFQKGIALVAEMSDIESIRFFQNGH